jgi:hypothetical protein
LESFQINFIRFHENIISKQQKQFTVVVQHQSTPHYIPVLNIFKIFVSEAVRKRSQQPFLTTVLKVKTGTVGGLS